MPQCFHNIRLNSQLFPSIDTNIEYILKVYFVKTHSITPQERGNVRSTQKRLSHNSAFTSVSSPATATCTLTSTG